ncbi:Hsp20/alpha crystallin family protein [Lewinella sp. JB7]|uniref:Hsp20/alpha crystallin family protein n=1 Tax=Lewinella sp. JB7 TaxID=2962887 RepID=UPI0020CA0A20|nr:Hsp20/alpha crystallin family protein [Lewinella sp. JB7]MCP9237262.1 Hsp20/alpha crystallin family protein [Lewinella sp. JB7]
MREFTSFRGITPANSRYRHIDHLFDEQRRRLFGDQTMSGDYELSIPGANITEMDEEDRGGYLIELAAPGYQRDDFHVSVHNDILTIKGELHEDRVRDHNSYSRREHNYHTFSRSFTLPESTDEENIRATYTNGILEVFVPVLRPVEETKTPRRIQVGS